MRRTRLKFLLLSFCVSAVLLIAQLAFSAPDMLQAPTLVPTANPLPTRTATIPPTLTPLPTFTLTPTLTATFVPFVTNTRRPTATFTATPPATTTSIPTITRTLVGEDPSGTPPPTWTPPPDDPTTRINDHYRLSRPIGEGGVNYADRTYPYGGTSGGNYQVHHGIEFPNPGGTPVLAAGAGTVVQAGTDADILFGPQTNYYGNFVVIEHNFRSPEGQPVYSLYGHMARVDVQVGQVVEPGMQVGTVGSSGVAIGSHLHFEIRVGSPNDFNATRNPDLWIYPYRTFGTLAGRVTDSSGTPLFQATVQIRSLGSGRLRYAFSYADTTVHGDDTFQENYAIGDIPQGYYEIGVNDNGRVRFLKVIYIYPDRTTWLDIQLN